MAVGRSSQIRRSSNCRISRVCASTAANGSSIKQHVRLQRQRARQAATLLHAARHLIGEGLLEAGQAHHLDEYRYLAVDLRLGGASHAQAIGDVLEHRLPREQAEMLEHHGNAGDRFGNPFLADPDLAGIVRQQAVDAAQQGRLAAAGRADNGHDLARPDLEIDVAEDLERAVVLAETLNADAGFTPAGRGGRGGAGGNRRLRRTHAAARSADSGQNRYDIGEFLPRFC